ncbi:uncharacterized protein CYBJADRAFT_37986 [Cyberlindnera jadinii NRRL Y-1542]|uniref:Uncharacterized protein n=1 Tax=Cyberlindnera jadinii (strain ATCC 18201 / CBS 1600 / BCRC 20928 / JCM 3617 / NBRC 0987 / NRRL Y-1542) TaxID=983966 RepID=A0A1E4RVB6_CYBJN|nr:hypothetical protein CYBJADRAFT_37986 [Cyberlindnera jadinii NRRL Y-1542]ODV71227.1 hypothetical protein CYBJADRAFT_37986 [Cyberlindnera jadinii NRRL Y-1542]
MLPAYPKQRLTRKLVMRQACSTMELQRQLFRLLLLMVMTPVVLRRMTYQRQSHRAQKLCNENRCYDEYDDY